MTEETYSFRTRPADRANRGFTLIELMIVISILAVLLALALPVYSNYAIRAKIGEGLSVANAVKTTVSSTCVENPALLGLDNAKAGYQFVESADSNSYIEDIQVSGPCRNPLITITTKNTGQVPAPVVVMTGDLPPASGNFRWTCSSSNTPNWLLPTVCRS